MNLLQPSFLRDCERICFNDSIISRIHNHVYNDDDDIVDFLLHVIQNMKQNPIQILLHLTFDTTRRSIQPRHHFQIHWRHTSKATPHFIVESQSTSNSEHDSRKSINCIHLHSTIGCQRSNHSSEKENENNQEIAEQTIPPKKKN